MSPLPDEHEQSSDKQPPTPGTASETSPPAATVPSSPPAKTRPVPTAADIERAKRYGQQTESSKRQGVVVAVVILLGLGWLASYGWNSLTSNSTSSAATSQNIPNESATGSDSTSVGTGSNTVAGASEIPEQCKGKTISPAMASVQVSGHDNAFGAESPETKVSAELVRAGQYRVERLWVKAEDGKSYCYATINVDGIAEGNSFSRSYDIMLLDPQ